MNDAELFSRLVQSGLPGSQHDIKNPTEDFVINVIASFFNKFSIDPDRIMQLSMEQLEALSLTSPENASIASIINLREAIMSIGPKLFLKDLSITDITSPTEKKIKNRLKILINFVIYATQKKEELKLASDEIFKRNIKIENLKQQKQIMIEEMNLQAKQTAEKEIEIEKINSECELIKSKIEKRKPYVNSLENDCHKLEEKKNKIRDELKKKKIELQKINEKNESLKLKIVKSPSKYSQRLHELKEEYKEKKIEKDELQKKVVTNTAKVQEFKDALDIVKDEHKKLEQVKELYVKLTNANENNNQLKKIIQDANQQINNEKTCNDQNGKIDTSEVNKCNVEVNQKLQKLNKNLADLMIEKKNIEKQFELTRKKEIDIIIEIDNGKAKINELDNETSEFLKQCQELYTNELKNIQETHEKLNIHENN